MHQYICKEEPTLEKRSSSLQPRFADYSACLSLGGGGYLLYMAYHYITILLLYNLSNLLAQSRSHGK